jgi:sulfite exporter TauE/SafE
MTDYALAFLAGLAGSLHCLGMCGGIVSAVALAGRQCPLSSRMLHQLLYNLGRITTYTVMGGVAGWLGGSLDLLGLREFSFWFMGGAYLFVLLVGIVSVVQADSFSLFFMESTAGRFLVRPLQLILSGTSDFRFYPLGLMLGFLPCGLLYALIVTATASGSPLRGSLIMASLGLGTLPAMLFVGSTASLITARVKGMFFRMVGLFVALMGGMGLWRVLAKSGYLPPLPF